MYVAANMKLADSSPCHSNRPQPHVYLDVEFADGRFLFDQTLPLRAGDYDWTQTGCVLKYVSDDDDACVFASCVRCRYPTPVRSVSLSVAILNHKSGMHSLECSAACCTRLSPVSSATTQVPCTSTTCQ